MNNLMVCSLPSAITATTASIQLLPFGVVTTDKGNFIVDQIALSEIVRAYQSRANDVVIDYEHQTLKDMIAPASGWIKQLTIKPGAGLWAAVEWTKRAKDMIKGQEYGYISPVVMVRKADKRAIRLHSAGLTNTPAIDGMERIAAKNSAVMMVTIDPLQRQINDKMGLADTLYLKHSSGEDELLRNFIDYGPDALQHQVNQRMGVSPEVFAKFNR